LINTWIYDRAIVLEEEHQSASKSLILLKWFDDVLSRNVHSQTLTPFLGVKDLAFRSDIRAFLKDEIYLHTQELITDLSELQYLAVDTF
jgi:hypothetical protein